MLSVNLQAYQTFWYFINERERIYQAKEKGLPKPWSFDPIFQKWKFCNVFRTQDKQTKWLLDNVIRPKHSWPPGSNGTILFNLYAFRAFNWYETYDLLRNVQSEWINPWNENHAKSILSSHVHNGNQLVSGAYMIRGMEGRPKYESIPEVLTQVWEKKDYLASLVSSTNSMETAYNWLLEQRFYGWGPFTTYQVLLDLTYTRLLNNPSDINTWCIFGPGAKRGIRLIYEDVPTSDMLTVTRELWSHQEDNLKPHVPPLTLQDIEFSLCELSKYWRISEGGKGSEKYAGTSD